MGSARPPRTRARYRRNLSIGARPQRGGVARYLLGVVALELRRNRLELGRRFEEAADTPEQPREVPPLTREKLGDPQPQAHRPRQRGRVAPHERLLKVRQHPAEYSARVDGAQQVDGERRLELHLLVQLTTARLVEAPPSVERVEPDV